MKKVESKIIQFLEKQEKKHHHIPLDVLLFNGNILIKSFRVYGYDERKQVVKGMTIQEEYSYLRENRDPVFAYFTIKEIKEISKSASNEIFLEGSIHVDTPRKTESIKH
ncbi:MAG: hypothetical protein H7259_06565 [Cytophagales bacterium]|nr:hypothetical protein [Cytophaga sp.]